MPILFDKLKERNINSGRFNQEIQKLAYDIRLIVDEIDRTEMWFESEKDCDLIDACLYQKGLLRARYRYLLKKIKRVYSCNNSKIQDS